MSALSSVSNNILSSLASARPTVGGLASGLDTDRIIQGLLAIQLRRIQTLEQKQERVTEQRAAFKGIEARLLSLQTLIGQLAKAQKGVFDNRTVTSSNESLVTAAASSSAVPGVYTVQVNALAKAHQVAAQGFDSATSTITQGTLVLSTGLAGSATITIDSTNNTLQGLANAINTANAGVTAALVNDGATNQPFRLLLTSNKTGTANSISITNNLGADSGGAVKPIFDQAYLGAAVTSLNYTGTSAPTSNRGAGNFTGAANNAYTFTVVTGGTVGTDNNLQVSYTDTTGTNTGTITINSGDAGVFKTVAQGIQVQFSSGTLVAGETFTIRGFVPTVQSPADASVTIGSGSGALTVTSAVNQLDSLIPGVTLNLLAADPAKTVTLTVGHDLDSARGSVGDLVAGYNDLMEFIDEQVRFDSETSAAGILLGNRQVTTIQDQVRKTLTGSVANAKTQMNRLSALGITLNDQGRLVINQTKLDDALAGRIAGVTLADVRNLFALAGTSTNLGVQFVAASAKTKASATPYQVSISQAAEQAAITATNALAASTVLTSANNTFTVTLDGTTSSTITLAPGTYSQQALAQEVQKQINANASLLGRQVTVTLAGGNLKITSNAYGATSGVAIGAGAALTPLGFSGTETDQGLDVVGHYLVVGLVEPATGTGQILKGSSANANTADLQVAVTLASGQFTPGVVADLTVTRGLASQLDVALAGVLDPVTGRLKVINDTFQSNLDALQEQVAKQNEILESRRADLVSRFIAMERTISELQGISAYLTNQFNALLPRTR